MLAVYCAMPIINSLSNTKVTLEDLVKDENNPDDFSNMTDEELAE